MRGSGSLGTTIKVIKIKNGLVTMQSDDLMGGAEFNLEPGSTLQIDLRYNVDGVR